MTLNSFMTIFHTSPSCSSGCDLKCIVVYKLNIGKVRPPPFAGSFEFGIENAVDGELHCNRSKRFTVGEGHSLTELDQPLVSFTLFTDSAHPGAILILAIFGSSPNTADIGSPASIRLTRANSPSRCLSARSRIRDPSTFGTTTTPSRFRQILLLRK